MTDIIEQARLVGFDLMIVVAGLGLFLFGINAIGDELKVIAGSRLKTIIDKYTTNKFKGFIVGIVVTALIQSSSATTALVISLIRSGIMTFTQSLAVMMGANIGTTITAIMIGFNLGDIAPYAILVGAFIELFAKNKKTVSYARLLIYFGILFFGLDLMGSGLKVLSEMPIFTEFAVLLSDNKYLGVMLGVVMTMIIQSSSASIGILQTLYAQNALSLNASLPMLLGSNVGTTITAVLAAIGGGVESKKAAFFFVLTNVIGTVIFVALLPYYTAGVESVTIMFGLNKMMELAFAHFMFNLITSLLLFPFLRQLEALINRLFKAKELEEEGTGIRTIFDKSIINESPALALDIAHNGTIEMAEYCNKVFESTQDYMISRDLKAYDRADRYELLINELNQKLSHYLVDISSNISDDKQGQHLNYLIYSIKDLERIGDHLMSINDHFSSIFEQGESLSEEDVFEIEELARLINQLLKDLQELITSPTRYLVDKVYGFEDEINRVEEGARFAFINRLKQRVPMGSMTMALYVDILSDFERVGDYSYNIATRVKDMIL